MIHIFLQCALGVALLNVQIPLVLGDVVNVVAGYTGLGHYLRQVHRPAMRLLTIYALQVGVSRGGGGLPLSPGAKLLLLSCGEGVSRGRGAD